MKQKLIPGKQEEFSSALFIAITVQERVKTTIEKMSFKSFQSLILVSKKIKSIFAPHK
jgi:hypothetical protein